MSATTRRLVDPNITVERRGAIVVLIFHVPGSKFGPVHIVLTDEALSDLSQKVRLARWNLPQP